MSTYNIDLNLDGDNLLRDLTNALLLRSDIHTIFDQRKFVFFPKDKDCLVVHMLEPTSDYGPIYHNTKVDARSCGLEFLYARFAWAIFPLLSGFLARPSTSRLVIHFKAGAKEQVEEEITKAIVLARKAAASRGNSPSKRARSMADVEDEAEPPYKVQRGEESETGSSSGASGSDLDYTSLEALSEPSPEPLREQSQGYEVSTAVQAHTELTLQFAEDYQSTPKQNEDESHYMKQLREEALATQRPFGYSPRPPYDRHRPAREELELMGVEIFENDFDGEGEYG
jgi:hypothetical protein